jgi:hypothetical protein
MKKVISKIELHNLIVELVRRHPDFAEVMPNQPYWHERDSEGCNWDLVDWNGPIELAKQAKNFIEEEVAHLRLKYDLPSK